jgi:hypothetical protein
MPIPACGGVAVHHLFSAQRINGAARGLLRRVLRSVDYGYLGVIEAVISDGLHGFGQRE